MNYIPAILTLSLTLPAAVQAQITYLDATTGMGGNTTLADGTPYTPVPSTAADGEWNDRAFANGGTILSSNETGPEDAPMLRTTISGLTAGEAYDIYGYLWGAGSWRLRALVDTMIPMPQLPGYNALHFATSAFSPSTALGIGAPIGPQPALDLAFDPLGFETDGHFANTVLIQEGNRWMYEVHLGTHTADANGEIWVFVDDLANNSSGNRTWYDGVGYELAPARFGTGCGNPTPTIDFIGVPTLGTEMGIQLTGAAPMAPVTLLLGISNTNWMGISLPLDLTPFGVPGCFLLVSPDATINLTADTSGLASFTSVVPVNTRGGTLYWQAITLDASFAAALTEGLSSTLKR